MEIGFPLLAIWIALRPNRDMLGPAIIFPAVYLLWYWLGSIPLVPGNDYTTLFVNFDASQWTMYLVGFAGLWLGLHLQRGEGKNLERLRTIRGDWGEGLFFQILIASFLLLLIAWAIIVSKEGVTILKDDVESLRVNVSTDNHITFQILMLAKLIYPIIYLYLWTAKPPKFPKTLQILGVSTLLILISTGNRSMALPPLMTVFVLRHYVRKPYNGWHLALAALILVPTLSITGYYRAIQHSGPAHARDLADMGFPVAVQPFTDIYLYVRAPLDTLRNVAKQIPANTPFQYGRLSTSFLTQLLPGRHPSTDFYFKDLIGHHFNGLGEPGSILAPFYADFGLAGVFVGMAFAGSLSKFLYLKMSRGSFICILLYSYFWQMLVASLYGSLITYIIELLIPIAWIMIVWLVVGKVTYRSTVSAVQKSRQQALKPALS
jgi:hypothetical protein